MDNLIAIGIRKRIEENISSELGIPKSDAEKIFNFIKATYQENTEEFGCQYAQCRKSYTGGRTILYQYVKRIVSGYSALFRYYAYQRSRLSYMQYARNIISGIL